MENPEIKLNAIGIVHCDTIPEKELRYGQKACIEVFEQYLPALGRINEHDYFWILCWLSKANRKLLETYSWHLKENNDTPFGVFSLRSPCRPNPVSLTLAKLLKIENNLLFVDGLDVFDKTAVVDIKPYNKNDIIFSPRAPYIRPQTRQFIHRYIYKKAFLHHQEECVYFTLAVRMALEAEEYLGDLSSEDVVVKVEGDPCLGDVIQGITGARIANPCRFFFNHSTERNAITWTKDSKKIETISRVNDLNQYAVEEIDSMDIDRLILVLRQDNE